MSERPTLSDLLSTAVPFAVPLHREFRGLRLREGVLIQGPSGWGEFAPFDDYSDVAAARWLESAIEAAYGQWPEPVRPDVPVNAILPAVPSALAADLTRAAVIDHGCTTIKVKVGSADLADDEARVAAVREVLTELLGAGRGSIRIDANGAWDVERGRQALACLAAFDLEYVEQPCRTREELVDLRSRVDVRFAVDELIRWADEPVTGVRDVADVAVLKPATLGGVEATLRLAERLDVPVVVSGSLDTSVGLATSIAAAAALPDLPYACGLGTGTLLADDLGQPVLPGGGRVPVERVFPDEPALERARARIGEERASYWHQRLAAAWSVKG
jgi:O-succinylbenzoate synthase